METTSSRPNEGSFRAALPWNHPIDQSAFEPLGTLTNPARIGCAILPKMDHDQGLRRLGWTPAERRWTRHDLKQAVKHFARFCGDNMLPHLAKPSSACTSYAIKGNVFSECSTRNRP